MSAPVAIRRRPSSDFAGLSLLFFSWHTAPGEISEIQVNWEIMSSTKATQLRPGMVIQHEGQLYTVFSVDHRTPGNKRGSMQTRLKNLRTGTMIDYRFRAEEFVDRAILDRSGV